MEKDCAVKCRSKGHAYDLNCAVTKSVSTEQLQAYLSRCHNVVQNSDWMCRTALHMAVSCGKWKLAEWLLSEKGAELSTRDLESGWTALHRALFYGQLHAARILTMHGASFGLRDRDGLTPLDLTVKDWLTHSEFTTTGPTEMYTWGENSNFTLGHESAKRHHHHEIVESFLKAAISIKQVVMCKYHTVFLSHNGAVYTCGHGRGGRLGHGNEQTILVPRQVAAVKQEVCLQVAAGHDHTIMLMESGAIYSCGLNDNHQLGIFPVPVNTLIPKQMNGKVLKGRTILGVLTQRFHTVLYTSDAVFTFGLNAGQLGHQKVPGEKLQSQPRQVAALNHKDIRVQCVACSDAATVITTTKGDVYVLHEYQCRKIVSKWLGIQQVTVVGGNLNHKTDQEVLREAGGSELVILLLNASGKVHVWRASDQVVRRCAWNIRRPLFITHISQSIFSVAMITKEGDAFRATLPKSKPSQEMPTGNKTLTLTGSVKDQPVSVDSFNVTLTDLVERDEIEEVKVERLPMVQKAIRITTDRKGQNFAVIQMLPNLSLTAVPSVDTSSMCADFNLLLEEADMYDSIHDCILQIGNQQIPSHRFILCSRSEHLRKLILSHMEGSGQSSEVPVIQLENADIQIFTQLLKFIYTDTCDLLNIGSKFSFNDARVKVDNKDSDNDEAEFIAMKHTRKMSAYEVHRMQRAEQKNSKSQGKESNKADLSPVKMLQEMAKKYAVTNLAKRLDAVKYVNGTVVSNGKSLQSPRLKFSRTKYSHLYDVCIQSDDGMRIQCHKCVLAGRLEYFHSMLGSGWIETSNSKALTLPVPGDILSVVIEYLYTETAPILKDSADVELICNLLVVADQLLITRLKQMCEVAITNLMSLKNVAELLEFASLYNADQLKTACQQFVCINLPVLMESRSLDLLSDEVMDELTAYYRNLVPSMSRRLITPYSDGPSYEFLESLELEDLDSETSIPQESYSQRKKQHRKRTNRTRSTSEDMAVSPRNKTLSESDDFIIIQETENSCATLAEPSLGVGEKYDVCEDTSLKETPEVAKPRMTIKIPARDRSHPWGEWGVVSPQDSIGASSPTSPGELPTVSPTSPTILPLRHIMSEQKVITPVVIKQSDKIHSASKKTGKLSQKERKKLLFQQEESLEAHPVESALHSSKVNPWAKITDPIQGEKTVLTSFRDLMLDDAKENNVQRKSFSDKHKQTASVKTVNAERLATSGASGDAVISWGLPTSAVKAGKDKPQVSNTSLPSPPPGGSSVWSLPPANSNAGQGQRQQSSSKAIHQSLSFSKILQDELQQRETLQKTSNKPLSLIQIEEKAIQELLILYRADSSVDEYITVERVQSTAAQPVWKAHT